MQQDTNRPPAEKTPTGAGRVLVLEDDPLLARFFGQILGTMGVADVAVTHDNAEAIAAIESTDIAAAFLDVGLENGTSEDTALVLSERGIPFAFVSGRPLTEAQVRNFPGAPVLLKPARKAQIAAMLATFGYHVGG